MKLQRKHIILIGIIGVILCILSGIGLFMYLVHSTQNQEHNPTPVIETNQAYNSITETDNNLTSELPPVDNYDIPSIAFDDIEEYPISFPTIQSVDKKLVYLSNNLDLVSANSDGANKISLTTSGDIYDFTLSPDRSILVYATLDGQLYQLDLQNNITTKILELNTDSRFSADNFGNKKALYLGSINPINTKLTFLYNRNLEILDITSGGRTIINTYNEDCAMTKSFFGERYLWAGAECTSYEGSSLVFTINNDNYTLNFSEKLFDYSTSNSFKQVLGVNDQIIIYGIDYNSYTQGTNIEVFNIGNKAFIERYTLGATIMVNLFGSSNTNIFLYSSLEDKFIYMIQDKKLYKISNQFPPNETGKITNADFLLNNGQITIANLFVSNQNQLCLQSKALSSKDTKQVECVSNGMLYNTYPGMRGFAFWY